MSVKRRMRYIYVYVYLYNIIRRNFRINEFAGCSAKVENISYIKRAKEIEMDRETVYKSVKKKKTILKNDHYTSLTNRKHRPLSLLRRECAYDFVCFRRYGKNTY